MQISDIPFGVTDWATVEPTEHPARSASCAICGR
jgi:hypothetical protein